MEAGLVRDRVEPVEWERELAQAGLDGDFPNRGRADVDGVARIDQGRYQAFGNSFPFEQEPDEGTSIEQQPQVPSAPVP
jgi:hypothetical protein